MSSGEQYPTIQTDELRREKTQSAWDSRQERMRPSVAAAGLSRAPSEILMRWAPVKAVALDLAGTLACFPLGADAYRDAVDFAYRNGIMLTKSQVKACLTEPMTPSQMVMQARGCPAGPEILMPFDLQAQGEASAAKPYPDALRLIAALRSASVPWTVASNMAAAYEPALSLFPDPPAPAALSFRLGCKKPDEEFFASVRAALGAPAENILFIGDNARSDIDGALRFGFSAAHLRRKGNLPCRAGSLPISSLDEIADMLPALMEGFGPR